MCLAVIQFSIYRKHIEHSLTEKENTQAVYWRQHKSCDASEVVERVLSER